MSQIKDGEAAPRDGRPVGGATANDEHRLARLLDSPLLARVVPHLPPEALCELIRTQGLDASAELVTLATPAQLNAVLDIDLWRHAQPGLDDTFNADRFGEWLEALADIGSSEAARTVASLDRDLVVAGLSRYVRVFDPGIFEPIAQSDDEVPDRHEAMREGDTIGVNDEADGEGLECEVGGYIVRARRSDAWDAVVSLLATLDAEHVNDFHALMEGIRGLGNSRPEIDGLNDLLMAPEQQLYDLTIDRERRRSQQGYATPADARAFLEMARRPKAARAEASPIDTANPIVTAYFRAVDEEPDAPSEVASAMQPPQSAAQLPSVTSADDVPSMESLDAVMEILIQAGVMPERPRALIASGEADPSAQRFTHLRRLMSFVHNTDAATYFTRTRELAFLANALVAGCAVQSRPFTPQEASDAAAGICNLGLEHEAIEQDSWLIDHDLVSAFEVGWSVLHRDVCMFVADALINTIKELREVDRDVKPGLTALKRALIAARKAGTPWAARDAAEILSMLDTTAWVSVIGLLGECPVLPAALRAVLDGSVTTVSPTAFEFISTEAQIRDVRAFMEKLPSILGP